LLQDIPAVAVQGYGPDGTTQYWNQASERLYGYGAAEAIGRNLLDLIIPPEMIEEVRGAIAMMAQTGAPIPASELSLMRKDGSRVAVFSCHAVVRRPGHPPELFCLDIDLTERKKAEQDLWASRESYRTLADNSPDFITRVDRLLRRIYANQAVADLLGVSREDMLTKTVSELGFSPKRAKAWDALLKKAITSGVPQRVQAHLPTHAGKKILDWRLEPEFDEQGQVVSVLNIARDITEEVQIQEELLRHRDRLEELVVQRTQELQQKTEDLQGYATQLEDLNTALRVLLDQRPADQHETENRLLSCLNSLVLPHLEELSTLGLSARQVASLQEAIDNLRELGRNFSSNLSSSFSGLTPREIQVAHMVRDGRTSKEIANILCISVRAVDFHRLNLRQKLGMGPKGESLRDYLLRIK
jgi:PAS domain S-box-containing protein